MVEKQLADWACGCLSEDGLCALQDDLPEDFHRDPVVAVQGGQTKLYRSQRLFKWQEHNAGKGARRHGRRADDNPFARCGISKLHGAGMRRFYDARRDAIGL